MNFIRNRNFRAGPQTSLEGFICPQNSDKQQKIKVFGRSEGGVLQYVTCEKAEKGKAEKVVKQVAIKTSKLPQPYTVKYAVDDIPSSRIATQDVWLRVKVHSEGIANQIQAIAEWSYSLDGKKFTKIGNPFTVREGKWIGAKLGFFNTRTAKKNDAAFFDVDWIHFEK